MSTPWFAAWFDSPYYPILYQNRNEDEAEQFVTRLVRFLSPSPKATFLDLACGRGRHAIHIHALGYDVTGVDLSPASIADAQLHSQEGLRFAVQDMRTPFPGKFDFILNLFTSFGYFENTDGNEEVVSQVNAALNPGGIFVIDFFNAHKVIRDLVASESKTLSGVDFRITRKVENGIIVKDIHVKDGTLEQHFQERVQALSYDDLAGFVTQKGMEVFACWGDYLGGPYHAETSDRCILFARKP